MHTHTHTHTFPRIHAHTHTYARIHTDSHTRAHTPAHPFRMQCKRKEGWREKDRQTDRQMQTHKYKENARAGAGTLKCVSFKCHLSSSFQNRSSNSGTLQASLFHEIDTAMFFTFVPESSVSRSSTPQTLRRKPIVMLVLSTSLSICLVFCLGSSMLRKVRLSESL